MVEFTVLVDEDSAPSLTTGEELLEDILVLHLEKGKDFFISVSKSLLQGGACCYISRPGKSLLGGGACCYISRPGKSLLHTYIREVLH